MLDSAHEKLLTEIIKKQMVILGPFIALYKARKVKGLTVADDGTVLQARGHPPDIIKDLIDQYVQLSGQIIQKAVLPILGHHTNIAHTKTAGSSSKRETGEANRKNT